MVLVSEFCLINNYFFSILIYIEFYVRNYELTQKVGNDLFFYII